MTAHVRRLTIYPVRVPSNQDQERESRLLSTEVDPLVRLVLDAADPWDAYKAANNIPDFLVDALDWMPHGGALYTTWSELTDLFEAGTTSIADAHAALRQAATDWAAASGRRSEGTLEMWIERTKASISELVERDGDFWRRPKV